MTQEKYNGYTNYETWATNLYLNNDEVLYNLLKGIIRESKDCYDAAEKLEDLVREIYIVKSECSLRKEFFEHSLSKVDFQSLGEIYFKELKERLEKLEGIINDLQYRWHVEPDKTKIKRFKKCAKQFKEGETK